MTEAAAAAGAPTSWIQRIRVPLGFVFALLYVLLAEPRIATLVPGLSLAAAGVALRTWAAGYLRKHESLSTGGPYRWTRNPLYLGSLLAGIGVCLAAASLPLTAAFVAFYGLVYLPVIRREETELLQGYGERYRSYRNEVPFIFPTGRRRLGAADDRFSWQQVWRNREHHAWAGALTVTAFLLIRTVWP